MPHLKGLNPKQKEAALHTEGPLLIIAGAGAGKTKTITHRILNLIKNGIQPENILAVTFTNKAAKEMRDRILNELERNFVISTFSNGLAEPKARRTEDLRKRIYGKIDSTPFIATFHSLGVYIIKENARMLGLNKNFTILDEGDSISLIKEAIKESNLDPKQYEPRKIKNIISREKSKFTFLNDFQKDSGDFFNSLVAQIWTLYEQKKSKENSLDFDDLLLKATELLKNNAEIRKKYQGKWQYIHIDEYQDTNEVQYLMAKLLAQEHKNICVVGDGDQCVYSWRGANLKNILSFEKDYPKTKIVILEENYRSSQNILEAANEIIKKNIFRAEKNLFTKNPVGEKISLFEALDENEEADFVATKILEILDGITTPSPLLKKRGEQESKYPIFPEIAILYRTNFQSRVLEEAMLRYNIPYQVLGIKFFERREIKDTLAYLRAALNPESLSDIKRIINFPTRGIGKITLLKLFAGQKNTLPIKMQIKINNFYEILEKIKEKIKIEKPSEVIKYLIKKTGIENELQNNTEEDLERLANIKELATLAVKYDNLKNGEGIEKLLEDAALASDQDSLLVNTTNPIRDHEGSQRPSVSNGVKLMTVHASKGLEFKYVFIVGLEDGLFPNQKKNDIYLSKSSPNEDSEEERRLFYVALTRAKKKLFLSFANYRTIFGSRQINSPSEFIFDIPANLIEKGDEDPRIKTIYL